MPAGRSAIPVDIKRALMIEAGHRCAIPTCRHETTVFAHIVPWRQNQAHEFANLIVLCPTCHARFDKGAIDLKSMLAYKTALSQWGPKRFATLDAFRQLHTAVEQWAASIRAIEIADVSEADEWQRQLLVIRCTRIANETRAAVEALAGLTSEEIAEEADWLFREMKDWADDVVDGLWPSHHPSATSHGDEGLDTLERMRGIICDGLGIVREYLKPSVRPEVEQVHLGGTGKRF